MSFGISNVLCSLFISEQEGVSSRDVSKPTFDGLGVEASVSETVFPANYLTGA